MIFKPIPTELRTKLIEEHLKNVGDVLTKEHAKEQEYMNKLSCLRCGGNMVKVIDSDRPWTKGKILPNVLAECTICGTTYSPYTGIEVSGPKELDELPD